MKLNEILQKLAAARLITLTGDKYELTHDTLAKFIAGKRSVEEQAVIDWENLLRNKLLGVKQSGTSDYLTVAQLEGLKPYVHKLQLNAEEQQFLQESQAFRAKEAAEERRRLMMLILFFVGLSMVVLVALFWAVWEGRKAQRELARNEKIVDGMYFYQDRFALCVKKDSSGHFKYGFLDKEGNVRIAYDYDEAVQFDDYGYARVKIKGTLYLIDTLNNRYPLAESLAALDSNTLALSLKEQLLDSLPIEILANLQLKVLYLRGNKLSTIPGKMGELQALKLLDLGLNNLSELPNELGKLKGLKTLDIRYNNLTNIDAITPLAQLEFLNLSHNKLEAIPAESQQWQALKMLDLSNNNLKKIPDEMAKLHQLKGLNLYNNPNLVEIPVGMIKTSLVIVLNAGQHAMLQKGQTTTYKNDLVGGKDTANSQVADTNKITETNKTTETEITEAARKAKEEADKKAILQETEAKKAAELAEAKRKAKEAADKKNTGSADIQMVFVEGGTFTMGCTSEQGTGCGSDEKPSHKVTLSNYSIGKHEVTQAQWKAVMGSNPSKFLDCDNCPVEQVSWDDIQGFIKKLNSQTGKTYRLPTEAEWEYAARGGKKSKVYKYSGSDETGFGMVAWYKINSDSKTHPVGEKTANELGIYDMSGNVWEWCSDWYGDYNSANQTNPKGASTGSFRVLRGGSWYYSASYCRSSYRNYNNPGLPQLFFGFRLVLVP